MTHRKWVTNRLLRTTELPTLPVYFIGYRLTLITIFLPLLFDYLFVPLKAQRLFTLFVHNSLNFFELREVNEEQMRRPKRC